MNLPVSDHASTTSSRWSGLSSRLAYLGYLCAVALGSVLVFFSLCQRDAVYIVGATMAGGVALGLRAVLRGRINQLEAVESFAEETDLLESDNGDRGSLGELLSLLAELDRLEKTRGSKRFDPWALQSVRSEIGVLVHNDPALQLLFQSSR